MGPCRIAILCLGIPGTFAALARPAGAATITRIYDLHAIAFDFGAPIDPVVGRFTVTFDDAADLPNARAGISVSGFNLPVTRPISFTFAHAADELLIGTDVGTGPGSNAGFPSFVFGIFAPARAARPSTTNFTYAAGGRLYSTFRTNVTATTASVAAIPEAAGWTMMVSGFGLLGASMRRPRSFPVQTDPPRGV